MLKLFYYRYKHTIVIKNIYDTYLKDKLVTTYEGLTISDSAYGAI